MAKQPVHNDDRPSILHLGLDPRMGVWSAMRVLAAGQRASGLYSSVGIAVLADASWPETNERELSEWQSHCFRKIVPKTFGTAQALSQCLRRPYIEQWLNELTAHTDSKRVILHFHSSWISGVLLPLRSCAPSNTKIIATFHGINPVLKSQPVRRRLHAWMSQRLLRSPAQLTSVDHPNLTTYENTLGIPPSRFTIVPNGVPDTSLRGCPFLSGKKPFTVGYVGRIFADKGWRRTADAIVRLVDAGENVRLILIGCGPDDDQARELSSRYPDNIQFRGNVPEARNTVMPEMDLLTLMSDYEAFPMVIIEAMSLGIPSAATAVGDIPLQIEHNLTGFVLPPSAEALAATIIQLIRNPDKLRATGEQARQRFEDRYTIDRIVHQYHRLYCEP